MWGIRVLGGLHYLAILTAILGLVGSGYQSPASAQSILQSPQLGLYDTAGYPYYPVETQVFGALRAHRETMSLATSAPESAQPPLVANTQTRTAAPVQVSRAPANLGYSMPGQDAVQVAQRIGRTGPAPLPDSMIMDPWTIGVFR